MKVTKMNNTADNQIVFVNGGDQTVMMVKRSIDVRFSNGFIAPIGSYSNNLMDKLLCRHTPFCGLLRHLKEEGSRMRLNYSFS